MPQQPTPELFFETVNAYQRSAALKAAIKLGLFASIGLGKSSVNEMAQAARATERGVRILCDYLVVIGFLAKPGGRYALTPDSAMFLDPRSPAYMGGAVDFLLDPMISGSFDELESAVRKGGTVNAGGTVAPEHPVWVKFARAMTPMMALPAQLMTKFVGGDPTRKLMILDIAAGHGIFGITLARHCPNAEVVALDWPNVLEVAKQHAQDAGVLNRYRTLAGNAFDLEYGSGYDIILLTNFLHHFDIPTCEKLLKKVHAAMNPGGRALTLEFIPNEDRVSPAGSAGFSLTMLATTPSGDAYTFSELERMFRSAGFSRSELQQLGPGMQQLIVSQ